MLFRSETAVTEVSTPPSMLVKDVSREPQLQAVANDSGQNSASMLISVVNLFKNIVGTSMLAMPYGIACSGILPSVFICFLFGALSAFTFALLGLMCGESKLTTYRALCEKYISKKAGVWVEMLLALYTFPACIAYAIFILGCVQKLIVSASPDSEGAVYASRWFIGVVLTVGILLPLCSTSKIKSLTYTSILGIGATVYCYIFVAVDLGQNANSVDISATIADALLWPPSGSLLGFFPMANIYAALYLVHYNAPKFFFELAQPTKRRFSILSFSAMGIAGVFCCSFSILGFARFGMAVPDNLLLEYSSAYAVWIATCVSLVTTYPFVFDAGRRSLISALASERVNEKKIFWISTVVLIPLFTIVAVFVENLAMVLGVNGALFGITVGFTLPGFLMVRRAGVEKAGKKIAAGWVIVVFGVAMTVLGLASMFVDLDPH